MAEKDKVLMGLNAHAQGFGKRSELCDAYGCPYREGENSCDIEQMCIDAISVMKTDMNIICFLAEKLTGQDERYANMVVSWLREIALNNIEENREMTFLDAVEDIRDRASYGLKNYFADRRKEDA